MSDQPKDNAEYLRKWAADIRTNNGSSVDADRLDAIAWEIERLRTACEASWAIGHKIYHNANAHESSLDWAQVRGMLAGVLNKSL